MVLAQPESSDYYNSFIPVLNELYMQLGRVGPNTDKYK